MAMFLVLLTRSGPDWKQGLPLENQSGWAEHAAFMDGLVAEGLVVLGGPLADERTVALAVQALSAAQIRGTLAADPWSGSHLEIADICEWTIRLDGRAV
jgi:hypothetical protein